jgi:hypothetical protein
MWAPFAELFGIRPWEFDRLTLRQFCALEQRVIQLSQKGGDDG